MATAWKAQCGQCHSDIDIADFVRQKRLAVGRSLDKLCQKCLALERVALFRTVANKSALIDVASAKALGKLATTMPVWTAFETKPKLVREAFSVTDEEILSLYTELEREDTPIVIAVAPTGAGKSTFLPYRLMEPIHRKRDFFTSNRQIVVTQPRRTAVVGISSYVSELHGGSIGAGHEIGYKISGRNFSDSENRLVYLTDGTLINWIIQGRLANISLIILDEAHERSLNIDLIIALLVRFLPRYPHLKVLIVSATIDHQRFKKHFDDHLPASLRCGLVECSGERQKELFIHHRLDDRSKLPYAPARTRDLSNCIADHLSLAIVRLLSEMESSDWPSVVQTGDIVGFLHGRRPIEDAVSMIRATLNEKFPQISKKTDIFPLFADLPQKEIDRATKEKADSSRRRVVIASNAAETSLTIDGLVHVVETGIIKQSQWDGYRLNDDLIPVIHSRAGCKQRWGRVGRKADGFAWCLYTEQQFSSHFAEVTQPEIMRSRLDEVILKAKCAGADIGRNAQLPWLDVPNIAEIDRTFDRLEQRGFLDANSALTETGRREAMSGGSAGGSDTRLLQDAERFGFGYEAAVLVKAIADGLQGFFPFDSSLSPDRQNVVRRAQKLFRDQAHDDLHCALLLHQAWQDIHDSSFREPMISWKGYKLSEKFRSRFAAQDPSFFDRLHMVKSQHALEKLFTSLKGRNQIWRKEFDKASTRIRKTIEKSWAERYGIDADAIRASQRDRLELLGRLARGTKGREERAIDFSGLDRMRVVLARSFSDHLYEAAVGERDSRGRQWYVPLIPKDREERIVLDHASICSERPPQLVLALGTHRPVTDSERSEVIASRADFAVSMDGLRDLLQDDVSHWALARRMEVQLRRPLRNQELDLRERAHAKHMSHFPIGSIVDCRVDSLKGQVADVTIIRRAGWAQSVRVQVGPDKERAEWKSDSREKAGFFQQRSTSASSRENFDDLMLIADDDDSQEDDATIPKREKFELNGEKYTGLLMLQDSNPINVGQRLRAEVTHEVNTAKGPTLGLVYPAPVERFNAFAKSNQPGGSATVDVLQAEAVGNRRMLRVREILSGAEFLVDAANIVSGARDTIIDVIPQNARLLMDILSIDLKAKSAELSLLKQNTEFASRLMSQVRSAPMMGWIYSLEANDDNYFLRVFPSESEPQRGQLASVWIRLDKSSVTAPDQTLRLGSEVPFRILSSREGELQGEWAANNVSARFPNGTKVVGTVYATSALGAYLNIAEGIKGFVEKSQIGWWTSKGRTDDLISIGDKCEGLVLAYDDTQQVLRLSIKHLKNDPWVIPHAEISRLKALRELSEDPNYTTEPINNPVYVNDHYPIGSKREGVVRNIIPGIVFVEFEEGPDGTLMLPDLGAYLRRKTGRHEFVENATDVVREGSLIKATVKDHNTEKKNLKLELDQITEEIERSSSPAMRETNDELEATSWLDEAWPWGSARKPALKSKPNVELVGIEPSKLGRSIQDALTSADFMLRW